MSEHSALTVPDSDTQASIHEIKEETKVDVSLTQNDIQYLQEEWPAVTAMSTDDAAVVEVCNTVGIIGLPSGDGLHILPKTDANLLYLLAYTNRVNERVVRDREPAAFEAGQSLPELLGKLFQSELDYIMRRGLNSAYEVQTGTERYVRGQIQMDEQLQRQGPVPTKFECKYQSLTHNIPINQVVLAATDALVRLLPPSGIRSELLQSRAQIADRVSLPSAPAEAFESISLTRLNNHYEPALLLAELILQKQLLQSFEAPSHPFPSMVFNMPAIFEEAVVRAVRTTVDQTRYRVTTNDLGVFATSTDGTEQRRLEPDFVIRRRREGQRSNTIVAVGDAKWKQTESPSTSDFYQVATYQSYAGTPGLLVYPDGDIKPRAYEYTHTAPAVRRTAEVESVASHGDLLVQSLGTATAVDTYQEYSEALERSVAEAVTELTAELD